MYLRLTNAQQKVDAADEAFARAGELNPRLDLTVVAQASDARANPVVDADARYILSAYRFFLCVHTYLDVCLSRPPFLSCHEKYPLLRRRQGYFDDRTRDFELTSSSLRDRAGTSSLARLSVCLSARPLVLGTDVHGLRHAGTSEGHLQACSREGGSGTCAFVFSPARFSRRHGCPQRLNPDTIVVPTRTLPPEVRPQRSTLE